MLVSAETVAQIVSASCGGAIKPNGTGYMVRCPAHDDKNPSLSLNNSTDGKLLVHCFAGCSQESVLRALTDLQALPERSQKAIIADRVPDGIVFNYRGSVLTDYWPYLSVNGEVLGYVCRYDNAADKTKDILPYFRVDDHGKWRPGAPVKPRPLFGLHTLSRPGPVYIVEGEKCAARLHREGVAAVTSMGGAEASGHSDWIPVYGKSVVLWPDFDDPGTKYITQIIETIKGHCPSIMVVDVKALNPPFVGWDVADCKSLDLETLPLIPHTGTHTTKPTETRKKSKKRDESDDDPSDSLSDSLSDNTPVHLTDYGNCQRFVKRFGARLRYVPAWDKWLVWDKKRWRPDDDGLIMRLAKDTALSLHPEVDALMERSTHAKNKQEFDQLVALAKATQKWANQTESEPRLKSMISLARSEPGIPVDNGLLDNQPWFLNCLNGMVNLNTGELLPHDPKFLITKMIHIEYHRDARAPIWESYLNDVQTNPEIVRFLQRAAGYSACGTAREQVVLIHHGHGQNGKSTFMKAMAAILGSGYCQKGNMSLFAEQSTDRVRNDVACLAGTRMLSLSETSDRMVMDEALVKAVTGGDIIKARFLNKEFFEFVPTFTVHIDTNHRPRIRGTEDGIWRRILLIPWMTRVPDEKKDLQLEQKLLAEKEGILNWIVQGALAYIQGGLKVPGIIREASHEYRRDEDIIGDWFDQCVVQLSGLKENTDDLFRSYERWCESHSVKPIRIQTWANKMADRGLDKKRTPAGVTWIGIGLKGSDYVKNSMGSQGRSYADGPQELDEF